MATALQKQLAAIAASSTHQLDLKAQKSAHGKSLLPIGVSAVRGEFGRGALVSCVAEDGREIARGLTNYTASEVKRIMRHSSNEIEAILGYVEGPELVHRDNLVLL